MFNEAITNDPTVFAIPVFIALIIIEVVINAKKNLNLYKFKDSTANVTMGLGSVVIGLLTKTFAFFVFLWIYQFRLFEIPNAWWMWGLLLLADDVTFYWYHRLAHQVRFFWAAHVQHHSSEHMNFSVALRQSWGEPFIKFLFYIWLPFIGFNPVYILIMQAISLVYQFFPHTKLVGKLGPIEWIFNTPSHHRVHHATQVQYLDKNHAGILIIWDRMFGTFQKEIEVPTYGITVNINSFSPLKIASHEYISLWQDMRRAKKLSDKIKYLINPPGWSHDGENKTSKELQRQLSK
jgi:sterol desaturase/sphingolipid hydroxylase (fatty acid hydroxylase superfamily)|tara:strand:+ start:538 stop:1413 length:876 start_codon:yes stop_codon:yes gene_type:complete